MDKSNTVSRLWLCLLSSLVGILLGCSVMVNCGSVSLDKPPNFLILFADDLGYGDLGFTGHPTIESPNLDHYARQGMILSHLYTAFPECSPSRASLLTGRQPVRTGVGGGTWSGGAFKPDAIGGLIQTELTFASMLRDGANYSTHMVGKWHLGQRQQYLPTKFGFEEYYGIPFSCDMGNSPWWYGNNGDSKHKPLPLMDQEEIIEQPTDLSILTKRYVDRAQQILEKKAENSSTNDQPFVLFFSFNHIHRPTFVSETYCNSSIRGRFGDGVKEMDWAVGEVMKSLSDLGLDDNTLVFFTSDNGPWLTQRRAGGSAGLFRSGKWMTWEGGIRMPGFVYWKDKIKPYSRSFSPITTMDLFPTMLSMANVSLPSDRIIDGKDVSDVFLNNGPSPHDCLYFYGGTPGYGTNTSGLPCEGIEDCPGLYAMRCSQYKLHFVTNEYNDTYPTFQNPPLLYDINSDPSELHPIWPDNVYYQDIVEPMIDKRIAFENTMDYSVTNEIAKGGSDQYYLCCDWMSQQKYPEYPQCTCNPENWDQFTCDPVCNDDDNCGVSGLYT